MNSVLLLIYIACSFVIILKDPSNLIPTILGGCENTLKFLPILFASYCLWLPVTKILEKSGISRKCENCLLPLNTRLFPGENRQAYEHLSVNISSNLLGIGGASTPSGLNAMGSMESKKNKIMLVVLNASSIQLIPTTVIALRASRGSNVEIILPTLITTFITAVISIILVKIFVKE